MTTDPQPPFSARVTGLFTKPTDPGLPSVPKLPIDSAQIEADGLLGDLNAYRLRKLKNTPDRALLLFDLETLETLQKEGWPMRPGDLGENILTSGLPAHIWREGTQLSLGQNLVIELTEPGVPCSTLHALPYVGARRGKSFIQALMSRRGWHAKVLTQGSLTVGDEIQILAVRES